MVLAVVRDIAAIATLQTSVKILPLSISFGFVFETFANNSSHLPGSSISGVLRSLLKQSLKSVQASSASIRFVSMLSFASLASLLKDCRINSANSVHAS